VDYLDAAVAVLREEGHPLHWTVIQDLALRRGLLDPFTQRDLRRNVLAALGQGVKTGAVVKLDRGVYGLPDATGD
jgi:hypothetical protein